MGAANATAQRGTLLLIQSDQALRRTLEALFADFNVICSDASERALALVRRAEPDVVLTSTFAGVVAPCTDIAKELPVKALVTVPSGTGVGMSIASASDQPVGLDMSAQRSALTPQAVRLPTLPPKLTPPLVAATNCVMASPPLIISVG